MRRNAVSECRRHIQGECRCIIDTQLCIPAVVLIFNKEQNPREAQCLHQHLHTHGRGQKLNDDAHFHQHKAHGDGALAVSRQDIPRLHDQNEGSDDPHSRQEIHDHIFAPRPVKGSVRIIIPAPSGQRIDRKDRFRDNDDCQQEDPERRARPGACPVPEAGAYPFPDDVGNVVVKHGRQQSMAQKIDIFCDPRQQIGAVRGQKVILRGDIDHFSQRVDRQDRKNGNIKAILRLSGMAVHQGKNDIRQADEQCRQRDTKAHICISYHGNPFCFCTMFLNDC